MKTPQFWAVMLLLALTALTVRVRGDVDHVPPSTPLGLLPRAIGNWYGTDVPLDPEVLAVLGKGVFLSRLYQPAYPSTSSVAALQSTSHAPGSVGLFIGYFPTQRTGQSIHSPQNCLPGSGWSFEASGVIALPNPTGKSDQVADYLISDGLHKAEVLYWYQTQGHRIANDYRAKAYMLMDSIRYGRTDAALVRVVAPLEPGEDRSQAQRRALDFAEHLAPLLPAYIPN